MSQADTDKIQQIIEAFSNDEKAVAVRSIPTEILQNELTRRIKRDKEKLKGFRDLVESMEKY